MKKPVIMIAEDESIIAMDIRNTLTNLGYSICAIVSSGEEAVEKAIELVPDLILMDIKLKGEIDGINAVKQLKKKLNIPAVYITAHTNEQTFKRAIETEPYGYLLKPVGKNDLYTTIETALHRNALENQLRESEMRYKRLVEHISHGIIEHDLDGKITFCNSTFLDMSGYSIDEIIGNWIGNFTPESEKSSMQLELFVDTHQPVISYTNKIKRKNGSFLDVQIDWDYRFDEKDNIAGFITVITDITTYKRSESALIAKEARYRDLFENAKDMIFYINSGCILTEINRGFIRDSGYDSDYLAGKKITDLLHPDDKKKVMECIEKSIKGYSDEYEFRLKTASGFYSWYSCFSRPVYRRDRTIQGIQCIARRITKYKNNDENFTILSNLVDNVSYVLTTLSNGTLEIEWVSKNMKEIAGITLRELFTIVEDSLPVHPDDMDIFKKHREKILSGCEDVSEFRILKTDGNYIRVRNKTRCCKNHEQGTENKIYGVAEKINISSGSQWPNERENHEQTKALIVNNSSCDYPVSHELFTSPDNDADNSIIGKSSLQFFSNMGKHESLFKTSDH